MSRKATISVDWKTYGLSTSLEVEAPDLVTYFKVKCQEIEDQGGWIRSPYDTYSKGKWYTFTIETDADDKTLQAAIDNGDLAPDGYDGTETIYAVHVNKGSLSFSVALQSSIAEELDEFYDLEVGQCNIYFKWKTGSETLESSITVKIPPFASSQCLSVPGPSTADDYYHDMEESLSFTFDSTFNESDIKQWITNGSIYFSPEFRHLQVKSGSSTYANCIMAPYEEWNQSSAKAADYASASFSSMTISFLKMIYYDGAIALGFRWIDMDSKASNYAVYMVRNVNGFTYSVSDVISYAASCTLFYSPGYIETDSYTYHNPANMSMYITSAPSQVTTSSSGFNFNNGTTSGSRIWDTCWLMMRFSNSTYAHDFVEMIRSHCITMTTVTPGSGVQVVRDYYEIEVDCYYTDLEMPSGNRNGLQINFGAAPSATSTAQAVTTEPGSIKYGNYYYVPLFKWVEYDILNSSSALSQGIRFKYTGIGVSGTTNHSAPSYFYPASEDALWRILIVY